MIGQTCILLFIPLELLLLTTLHAAINFFRRTIHSFVKSLYNEKIRIMPYILRINRIPRTFAEREKINSIQQVCLSHSVLSEESI